MTELFNLTSHSESETAQFVEDFSSYLQPGDCIALNGELGAGKTFFTKCLGSLMGIAQISSPTFALVNVYEGTKKLYHLDFYRIRSADELFDIGFFEMLNDLTGIVLIEWADLFPEVLPQNRFEITIDIGEDTTRQIKVLRYE